MEQVSALEPHRWTREEYDRIVETGAIDDLPVELLDGVIVEVTPEGEDHADVVQELLTLLAPAVAVGRVRAGQPLRAGAFSEPEPDLAVVPPRTHRGHPFTANVAIEVVVSRRPHAYVKRRIYAAAGVGEYWIVDVPKRLVEVLTTPTPDGYAETRTLRGDDVLTVPAFGIETTVAGVFARAGLE